MVFRLKLLLKLLYKLENYELFKQKENFQQNSLIIILKSNNNFFKLKKNFLLRVYKH